MAGKRERLQGMPTMPRLLRKVACLSTTFLLLSAAVVVFPVCAAAMSKRTYHPKNEVQTLAPVVIPGTGVSLIPPPGFALATKYTGLENLNDSSSILLVELPGAAYGDLSVLFTSTPEAVTEAFAQRGLVVSVESLSTLVVGDTEVPVVIGTQSVGELRVKKYFALFGEGRTMLLTFNIMPTSPLDASAIVETMRSVEILPAPSAPATAAIPFTVEAISPFQRAYGLLGASVLLNLSGELDAAREEPLIIVASSLNPTAFGLTQADVSPSELANFSAQLLRDTPDLSVLSIDGGSPVEFAGGAGYLMEATSQEGPSSAILQYVRVLPDGHYIRMVVLATPDALIELRPAIEAVQRSVVLR